MLLNDGESATVGILNHCQEETIKAKELTYEGVIYYDFVILELVGLLLCFFCFTLKRALQCFVALESGRGRFVTQRFELLFFTEGKKRKEVWRNEKHWCLTHF